MATILTTTIPVNGSRDFVAIIQIDGTSAAAELAGAAVIDPQAAITNVQASVGLTGLPADFKIKRIDWNLTGFSAQLEWDATTPIQAAALSQYGDTLEFFEAGAPVTNGAGTGKTGKLLITTKGLVAGMWGTIIINGYH